MALHVTLSPRNRFRAGAIALVAGGWLALWCRLWCYGQMEAHRFTSRAILTGVLWMRGAPSLAAHDEQVFDGAVYTNWGFGVPLLQAPFHALAASLHWLHGFFPERAIFFVYMAVVLPIVWRGIDRLLASRSWPGGGPVPEGTRCAVSWAGTWVLLCCALYPLLARRFIVYEETIAYLVLAELAALTAYLHVCGSSRTSAVLALGIAAGVGLVIRPTGLIYVGVWGLLLLLDRKARKALAFGATVAPFVAFWLWSNRVRTGSPFGLGFDNSNPFYDYHTAMQRFGSSCGDTPVHTLQAAWRLFEGFFFFVSSPDARSWMHDCHFEFEGRDSTHEPFFSPAVLVMLAVLFGRLVRRRERRLALYLPYATFAVLFASFVHAGAGFAWRYAGDFWPLIALAVVDYVRTAPVDALRPLDLRLAKVLAICGVALYLRLLVPWEWGQHADVLSTSEAWNQWDAFADSRWPLQAPVASRIVCGARPDEPYHNGLGWKDACGVGTFTNVVLGVPTRTDAQHELRIETDDAMPEPRKVYVNGRTYPVLRDGAAYRADVTIDPKALLTPVVTATVEWTRDVDPAPPGHLLAIELL